MEYRVQVFWSSPLPDGRSLDLVAQLERLGKRGIGVSVSDIYFLRGTLSASDVEYLARELLVDPVVEDVRWRPIGEPGREDAPHLVVEVGYHPGVTDPVADNLLRRAHLLGIAGLEAAGTGTRYTFQGALSDGICTRLPANCSATRSSNPTPWDPSSLPLCPQAEPSTAGRDCLPCGAERRRAGPAQRRAGPLSLPGRDAGHPRLSSRAWAAIRPTSSWRPWPRPGPSTVCTRPSRP